MERLKVAHSSDVEDAVGSTCPVGSMRSYYYDDLAVGQTWTSQARTVTEADIVGFAGISGDFNPIHLDRESAAGGIFGQRVAHGILGLAMATGFIDSLGIFRKSMGAMLGIDEWKFSAPVFIGDTIRLKISIESMRMASSETAGIVRRRMTLLNQHDQPVQSGIITVMVRRRPTTEPNE